MNGLGLFLACLIAGTGTLRAWAAETQFSMVINTSAKKLTEAFPAPINYANVRLNESVLTGARRIPVKEAKPAAVQSSLKWVKRVINPKWLPEDGISARSLILVRGEGDGPDVVRATWQSRGYQIEVSQIVTILVIKVVPPRGSDMGTTLNEKALFVKEVCAQLFADRDTRYSSSEGRPTKVPVKDVGSKICEYSFKSENVKVFPDGIIGVPVTQDQAGVRRPGSGKAIDEQNQPDNPSWDQTSASWSYWWRHVCWWNDGATIGFYFPKHEAGPFGMDCFTTGRLRWLEAKSVGRPGR